MVLMCRRGFHRLFLSLSSGLILLLLLIDSIIFVCASAYVCVCVYGWVFIICHRIYGNYRITKALFSILLTDFAVSLLFLLHLFVFKLILRLFKRHEVSTKKHGLDIKETEKKLNWCS